MSVMLATGFRLSARGWRDVASLGVAGTTHYRTLADSAVRRRTDGDLCQNPVQISPALCKHVTLDRRILAGDDSDQQAREKETRSTSPATTAGRWANFQRKASPSELKRLMRNYGPIAVGFHLSVFFSTFGGFYALVDQGVDIASLMKGFPVIADNLPSPGTGNLALAWALTSLTGPPRAFMTITLTPQVARRWWGRDAKRKLAELEREAKARENEEQ